MSSSIAITDELVAEIADRMAEEGQTVSPVAIWSEVHTGSVVSVAASLRKWREARAPRPQQVIERPALPATVTDTMRDALDRLWTSAQDEAERAVARRLASMRQRVDDACSERDDALSELQNTVQELDSLQVQLDRLTAAQDAKVDSTSGLEDDIAQAVQRTDAAEKRAQELVERVEQLEADLARALEELAQERAAREAAVAEAEAAAAAAAEAAAAVEAAAAEAAAVAEAAAAEAAAREAAAAEAAAQEAVPQEGEEIAQSVAHDAIDEEALRAEYDAKADAKAEAAAAAAREEHESQRTALEASHAEAVTRLEGELEAIRVALQAEQEAHAAQREAIGDAHAARDAAALELQMAQAQVTNLTNERDAGATEIARLSASLTEVQEHAAELVAQSMAAGEKVEHEAAAPTGLDEEAVEALKSQFAQEAQVQAAAIAEAHDNLKKWSDYANNLKQQLVQANEKMMLVHARGVGEASLSRRLATELGEISPENDLLRKEVQQRVIVETMSAQLGQQGYHYDVSTGAVTKANVENATA
ncbi:ATPase [Paraburkholderia sp. Ac-20340]|uniref:DNA-binding protein n=1 Tax=Paraburkholderia sp. Ac-20340 TaxID=2703888 RepID=UPI00197EDF53|nr:DNA-binding protein [Paraburkholderia sp. Ac-20340]MBN3858773.1 ATPase [Paraburkholderia sp. Ac-20340]